MLSLVNTFLLFSMPAIGGITVAAPVLMKMRSAFYVVLIQKDCARINNLRAGRCDFLVILLTKKAREALLLRNGRPVALLLLCQTAAEGRRKRRAVLQRL